MDEISNIVAEERYIFRNRAMRILNETDNKVRRGIKDILRYDPNYKSKVWDHYLRILEGLDGKRKYFV